MAHKMRLRWNTEASYFRCWIKSSRVCSCVHAHMKQNEPSAFYVFEVFFSVQTSILRFFNEPHKNNHKTNIKMFLLPFIRVLLLKNYTFTDLIL